MHRIHVLVVTTKEHYTVTAISAECGSSKDAIVRPHEKAPGLRAIGSACSSEKAVCSSKEQDGLAQDLGASADDRGARDGSGDADVPHLLTRSRVDREHVSAYAGGVHDRAV
jgi:hypothetical protein